MPTQENKAAIRRALEKWNQGNLAGYLEELYDAGCVLHGYPGVEAGIESIRQFYQGFWAAFPNSQITVENDMIAEGDKVGLGFVLRASHQGEFMGVPPTGNEVSMTGITILRFANGKCVERWSQADFLGLMQQLGVVPEMGG